MIRWWPWCALAVLAGLAAWSWSSGGIVAQLVDSDADAAGRVAALRQYFRACGAWAPVVYVIFVTTEVVVAPIPGILLYAPGGMLFGTFAGGTLALIGNTLGAGIACALVRSVGQSLPQRFFDADSNERLQRELEHRGAWWILLLRANPLTSTDLLSYAAGATRIPVWKVMLATGCGMAPLCYAQSWMSDSLFARFPWLVYPLLGVSVVYVIIVVIVLKRLHQRRLPAHDDSDNGSIIQHEV